MNAYKPKEPCSMCGGRGVVRKICETSFADKLFHKRPVDRVPAGEVYEHRCPCKDGDRVYYAIEKWLKSAD